MRHLPELKELFVAVARLAKEMGLVKLGTVALDGTKVKAQASKHKAMSYGRMKEQEQKLKAEIEALLERARQTDVQEDAQWGTDQSEEPLPQELKDWQDRLAEIEAAKQRLEERQAQADRERGRHPDDGQRRGDGAGRPFKRPFRAPEDKAKQDFAFTILRKYVGTQDQEVLNTMYNLYKERLAYKPTPTASVAESMLYLLSRSSPQVAGATPEGFIETGYVNELESSGYFEEMSRQYGK